MKRKRESEKQILESIDQKKVKDTFHANLKNQTDIL